MRKWLLVSVLALAGMGFSSNRASAWWGGQYPYYASASFPMITPSGYFSNSYYFAWYYPWYANYNYSHGHYANWWYGGGYAYYYGQQMYPSPVVNINIYVAQPGARGPILPPPRKDMPKKLMKEPGKVSISLPADAKLLFNGVVAGGKGETRSYVTPDLNPDQDYEYVLTAEVVRDGQTMTATQRVIVRSGEETTVTLKPSATAAK